MAEYEVLGKAGKGALLRREGIYSSLIAAWRQQRDQGALQALAKPAGRPQADAVDRENVRLRARVVRLFRTLKYRPEFPATFASLPAARAFCQRFFGWYNTEHRHSGVAWHTPHNVHYGHAQTIHAVRADVLTAAYTRNPERFVRKHPQPAALPIAAWINKPAEQEDSDPSAHPTKT